MNSEPGATPALERARKRFNRRRITEPTHTPFGNLAVRIQVVEPGLNLPGDLREFQHRLPCRHIGNNFLRLGRRIARAHEMTREDLFPALAPSGSFRTDGLARRTTPVRAIRRCSLARHDAVSCFLLCHTLGLLAKCSEPRERLRDFIASS